MANPHFDKCPDYLLLDFEEAQLMFMVDGKMDEVLHFPFLLSLDHALSLPSSVSL